MRPLIIAAALVASLGTARADCGKPTVLGFDAWTGPAWIDDRGRACEPTEDERANYGITSPSTIMMVDSFASGFDSANPPIGNAYRADGSIVTPIMQCYQLKYGDASWEQNYLMRLERYCSNPPAPHAYTLDEIDRMRAAVAKMVPQQNFQYVAVNGVCDANCQWTRSELIARNAEIEDRLRTYMQFSISPEALEAKAAGAK